MKFKFIAVFSIMLLCFVNISAQKRNIEIEVSLTETHISMDDDELKARVKITNKSKESLNTEGLGDIELRLSKCLIRENCNGKGLEIISKIAVPQKTLRENESFEFVFDLLALTWVDKTAGYFDINQTRNFKSEVSAEFVYFQGIINLLKGYKKDEQSKRLIPITESFRSNTINVVINQ